MILEDDVVGKERRMGQLFMLAMASRTTLMSVGTHWGIIAAMVLIETPIAWAAEFSLVITILLAVAMGLVFTALNSDGRVSERMKRGPAELLRHSVPILLAAAVSDVGGMMLFAYGETAAALWAMGLGSAVMICEVSALLGTQYLRAHQSGGDGK